MLDSAGLRRAGHRRILAVYGAQSASIMIGGHAFVQNVRRGHYELGVEARHEHRRLAVAFDELTTAI
jgi:IS6 family transposase